MTLYPTRNAFHVALAGTAMVVAGVALHRAAPTAFGSALLLALALGRALSRLAGSRLRRAGFEMTWAHGPRVVTVARGETCVLPLQLKNRSRDAARAVGLRAIASSLLETSVSPAEVDLPAGAAIDVELQVTGRRTGRWGLHGLALELRGMPLGGDGLFEVPLVFSSPFGVEVQPRPLALLIRSPRGGRSGRAAEGGRSARLRGEGDELRELRDHVVGDPFKRIAWRASARRGRLVVREMERQERDVVWLVLDASVEGWAGPPGKAPLDAAVDEVAAVAARHLSRGDRVGLVVYASRPRAWLPADGGPAQAALIAGTLTSCSGMMDVDRSGLDETEVGQRVAEHLRPLARDEASAGRLSNLDRLAQLAEATRSRAPFEARVPYAPSPRERTLRHYLACFGIEGPPRQEGERARAEPEFARMVTKLLAEKPRPTIVAVWAPAPASSGLATRALRALKAKRIEVTWTLPETESSLGASSGSGSSITSSVDAAVRIRALAERTRALAVLRSVGIRATPRPEPSRRTKAALEPEVGRSDEPMDAR